MVSIIAILHKQFYSILIICLHTVKWLQGLQFKTNYSIQHYSSVCTQLNSSKYCYVSLTVQLNMSFVYIQINDQTVLFQTIQFSIGHLSNSSIWLIDRTLSGATTLGVIAKKRYFIFLNASAFLEFHSQIVGCHIQDTHWGGSLLLCANAVGVFYSPSWLG